MFESGSGFCNGDVSCQARCGGDSSPCNTNRYNSTEFFDGVLSPFPEGNPNLYKSPAVLVPYCTSDLWLGNTTASTSASSSRWQFQGQNVLREVVRQLLTDQSPLALRYADTVVVFGDVGVMQQLAWIQVEIRRHNSRAASGVDLEGGAAVIGVCDGCLRVDPSTQASQTYTPISDTLRASASVWQPGQRGDAAWAWYGDGLMHQLETGGNPVLFQQSLFDQEHLLSMGLWPATTPQQQQYVGLCVNSSPPPPIPCALTRIPYHIPPAPSAPRPVTYPQSISSRRSLAPLTCLSHSHCFNAIFIPPLAPILLRLVNATARGVSSLTQAGRARYPGTLYRFHTSCTAPSADSINRTAYYRRKVGLQ